MPKVHNIQNSFTGGEISPRLYGRTDTSQYQNSTEKMLNAHPFVHGGCTRRVGTKHIFSLWSHNEYAPKLIRFVYSRELSYLLVIHSGTMYFVRDGYKVGVQIGVPWSDWELDEIRYAQQGNIMIFVHPNYAPVRLVRYGETNWQIETISFLQYAVSDSWFRTAPIDLKIIADGDLDTEYNVGDYWRWTTSTNTVTVAPVLYDSDNNAIAAEEIPGACVIGRVNDSYGDGVWNAVCIYSDSDRSEWSVTAPNNQDPFLSWEFQNYPQTVTFYQQRLWFGGTPNDPQTVWASQVDDYQNFTLGAEDNDALQFKIASPNNDPLIHIVASPSSLLLLTYSTEYAMSGGSGAITPTNVLLQPQTYHGISNVRPIQIGTDTLFIQRDGEKMRTIYFDINQSQNLAEDLTLFSEHITGEGIRDMSFAQEPDNVVWSCREDGVLLSTTYQRDQSVAGWARHETDGYFRSVCVVPEDESDTVYVCVDREDPSNYYYPRSYQIEVFGEYYLDDYEELEADIYLAPEGTTDTWQIPDRFQDRTVQVLADGYSAGEYTADGTTIVLDEPAANIVVGLRYDTEVTFLHPEPDIGQTSQGRALSIDKMTIRFQDTIGAYVKSASNTETVLPFITFSDGFFSGPNFGGGDLPYGGEILYMASYVAPVTYSGLKTVNLTGWSVDNNITIGQNHPYPWTVLSVVMRVTVNDM